ncbi:hypothetical protein [Gimesia maris]|uniref:hypothetical protein n=1 Tax=Gimesia maris TaxID=122 RepID=UPI003A8E2D5C
MKKFWKTKRYKQYNRRHAARQWVRALEFKNYRRRRNLIRPSLSKVRRQFRHRAISSGRREVTVEAPEVLSLVRNPEETTRFIEALRGHEKHWQPVWVELKGVKEIDYNGILVLLSVMVRFNSKKIPFNGDKPDDPVALAVINESKFFQYVYWDFNQQDRYTLEDKSSISTHAFKTVDSLLGAKLIDNASQTIWGEPRRCPDVQRVLIELMHNTNNHASIEKLGDRHWWVSVKHIEVENRVAFSFVDYGVGIFYNLRHKERHWLTSALSELVEKFTLGNDVEIFERILSGEIHRTASNKPYRGKGLPGIYEAFERNSFSNLTIVTNDVYFSTTPGESKMLDTHFRGTFVYWELSMDNWSLEKKAIS